MRFSPLLAETGGLTISCVIFKRAMDFVDPAVDVVGDRRRFNCRRQECKLALNRGKAFFDFGRALASYYSISFSAGRLVSAARF